MSGSFSVSPGAWAHQCSRSDWNGVGEVLMRDLYFIVGLPRETEVCPSCGATRESPKPKSET